MITVVLYDKEGTIQRAGCQLPDDRLRWLHLRAISPRSFDRPHPCEVKK